MVGLAKSDVLIDLCTQRDYLAHGGSHPVENSDAVVSNVRRIMVWARWTKTPIVSVLDTQRREESLGVQSPTCVVGTWGQQKVGHTLMPSRASIESDNCLCVALDVLLRNQQVLLTKRHRDPLTNPKLDRLLTEMPARRFVVFGIGLDTSIRPLILGLLLRGRQTVLLSDACGYWNLNEADFCLRQIHAKGAALLSTDAYLQEVRNTRRAPLRRWRNDRSVA
ncbi:MAG: hypothetical protein CHACPFDD_02149 [Phycisphaerae bacterium]|nr:hypothetical protein [Phycisphaerae bacterium]